MCASVWNNTKCFDTVDAWYKHENNGIMFTKIVEHVWTACSSFHGILYSVRALGFHERSCTLNLLQNTVLQSGRF